MGTCMPCILHKTELTHGVYDSVVYKDKYANLNIQRHQLKQIM
jgi:hypothetical protein